MTKDQSIDKEWFISLGAAPDMPIEGVPPTDYGLKIYGKCDEYDVTESLPNIHLQIIISFREDSTEVYLEEYDDGGFVNGVVELPMIKTRVDLLTLMSAFGVTKEWGDAQGS